MVQQRRCCRDAIRRRDHLGAAQHSAAQDRAASSAAAIASRMSVNLIPPREQVAGKAHRTWDDVAAWYAMLTSDRIVATPAIAAKAHELIAGKNSTFDKIAAIGAFTQHDVRYVAIEIGLGGYQPHHAGDILTNHRS